MNFEFSQKSLGQALREKNFALYTSIFLGISNIIMVGAFALRDDKIILIPLFNLDHRLTVHGGQFNDSYFVDWADSVLKTILIVNPDTVDWKVQDVLKVSSNDYGDMKQSLEEEVVRIKANELSTVFYPKEFTVNQDAQKVVVRGQYMAYFGRDKTPVIKDKTYELSWVINNQGAVMIRSLKDLEDLKAGAAKSTTK